MKNRNLFKVREGAMKVAWRRLIKASIIGGLTLAASLGVASPQFSNSNGPYVNGNDHDLDHSRLPDDQPFVTREMQERQLKRLREEHQKQMFSDTAELLKLANALRVEVDKSDTPTPNALRDVDEISKLAKRVSERIKTQ